MAGQALSAEIMRPSRLGDSEFGVWRALQTRSPSLQRAFLSPTFATACEQANGRSYVAVLHHGGRICGFFPFQFRSAWHQRFGLAERIGGGMSDAAGLIAEPGLRVGSAALMRLCGVGALFITHLQEDQAQHGLEATWSSIGHVTDIGLGSRAYFAAMAERNRDFVRDTERRLRRAERLFGTLRFSRFDQIPQSMVEELIDQKREQYRRTRAVDALRGTNVRLISALREAPAPDCTLVLTSLQAGDRMLAQHLGPQHHDVLSYWFPVYDQAARDVSPGRLLLWHTIQRAEEIGIRLIDRGEGDMPHKRELATGTTRYGCANWVGAPWRSSLARMYQSLEWRLDSWLRRKRNRVAQQV